MNLVRLTRGGGGGGSIEPFVVIIHLDSNFEGQAVTLSQSGQTPLIKYCPMTAPYDVTFKPLKDGVWDISTSTIDGTPVTGKTDPLLEWTTYEYTLQSGFNFTEWLTRGRVTETFSSLDDVLADETTIRQLMTVHDSVDYMVETLEIDDNLRSKLLDSDYALKWIGLRDYAYNEIENEVSTFITDWLLSDKWEYALKDRVPIMTGNNAPYGTALYYASYSGLDGYRAFDGNDASNYLSNGKAGTYLGYKFPYPVNVKKVRVLQEALRLGTYRIEASNDTTNGSDGTWKDLTGTLTATESDFEVPMLNNDDYYMAYRLYCITASGSNNISIYTLQFYGRSLSVSVPKMSGNNELWGEVSASTLNADAYKAFTDDINTGWRSESSDSKPYITIKFPHKILPKMLLVHNYSSAFRQGEFELYGSNDGTFTDILSPLITFTNNTNNTKEYHDININQEIQYFRIVTLTKNMTNNTTQFTMLNIYGLDYSEKEFGDSKIEYIFDHGVELKKINSYVEDNGGIAKNDGNELRLQTTATSKMINLYTDKITFALDYKVLRAVIGNELTNGASAIGLRTTVPLKYADSFSPRKNIMQSDAALPFNFNYDISNFNGQYYIMYANGASGSTGISTLKELWLERS